MLDALKTLFENNVISEEIRESIEQAWEARITENREQVAQQLKILPRMVENIEAEQYQSLPEPIFIKGYLRLYADLLSLSSQEICQLFDASYSNPQTETHKATPQVLQILDNNPQSKPIGYSFKRTNKWLPIMIKALLVVLLIGAVLAGLWQSALFRQNQQSVASQESANNQENRTIALENTTSTRQSIDTLNLRFSAETKLRIADANGQELVNTTKQAGESLSIQGQSPFAIELNPATAVEFRFNNSVIDLKPYTVNGVVNFRLSR